MQLSFENSTKSEHGSDVGQLDFNSPILNERKPINRFMITSGIIHVMAATAILVSRYAPEKVEQKELVEIEFANTAIENSAPAPAPVPVIAAPAAAAIPEVQAEVPAAPPVVKSKPVAAAKPVAKAAPVVPATLDDIQASPLDSEVIAKTQKQPENLNSQDLDQDLNKVDQEQAEQLKAANAKIDEDAKKVEEDLAKSTAAAAEEVKKQNEMEAAQVAARAEGLRREQEKAREAALAQAQAKANADAEAAAAASAAQAAEAAQNAGSGKESEVMQVRALEQLRQMPGNPRPQYDQNERLAGHKGQVVLQAYVTQDGRLTEFKLLKSTGHKNLDFKTLKALKSWKFYPGQEGWVELPFEWDLKGGPQEVPAYLRRKVGQSGN